ncbi:hypothetical protein ZYGR_0I04580 [Zygosaccharomyces rouxii]|uniref:Uncharacterized protein n=1 Tax=Zygosaccharomyces rouxii TaxID=4956 RepID=A0A1Q2ZXI7_ZYGRO|nr:hypothetical protein ZYGR_0I04580 [Zygosaccharomyces rouxii]
MIPPNQHLALEQKTIINRPSVLEVTKRIPVVLGFPSTLPALKVRKRKRKRLVPVQFSVEQNQMPSHLANQKLRLMKRRNLKNLTLRLTLRRLMKLNLLMELNLSFRLVLRKMNLKRVHKRVLINLHFHLVPSKMNLINLLITNLPSVLVVV